MTVRWNLTIEGSPRYIDQGTACSRTAAAAAMIDLARLRATVTAPHSRFDFSIDEEPVATLVTGTRDPQDHADVLDLLDEVGAAITCAAHPVAEMSNLSAPQRFPSARLSSPQVDRDLSAPDSSPSE